MIKMIKLDKNVCGYDVCKSWRSHMCEYAIAFILKAAKQVHGFVGMIHSTDLYMSVALTPLRTSSLWSLNIIKRLIFQLVLLFTELICRWQSYVIKDNGKQHLFCQLILLTFLQRAITNLMLEMAATTVLKLSHK